MPRGKALKTRKLIDASYEILREIQPATVRAVCYKLFTHGLIKNMSKNETNKVSRQLTWAREAGEIPWAWLVDDSRRPERAASWADPEAYLRTMQRAYRKDRWATQPKVVEVWSEKATVKGVLRPVLDSYGLTFQVMHGYGSECWELDALSPVDLRQRVSDAIWAEIDVEAWERARRAEAAERQSLLDVAGRWREALG